MALALSVPKYYTAHYTSSGGDEADILFTHTNEGLTLDEEDIVQAMRNVLLANGAVSVSVTRHDETSTDVTPT